LTRTTELFFHGDWRGRKPPGPFNEGPLPTTLPRSQTNEDRFSNINTAGRGSLENLLGRLLEGGGLFAFGIPKEKGLDQQAAAGKRETSRPL